MTLPLVTDNNENVGRLHPLDAATRLRFVGCRVEHSRGGFSRAVVDFDGALAGERTSGVQVGPSSAEGDLRLAAQATIDAIVKATHGVVQLDLMGVKLIRAFDTNIVVVAVFVLNTGETSSDGWHGDLGR